MSIGQDRERLSQATMLEWLLRDLQTSDMLTVYLYDTGDLHNRVIYSALIPSSKIEDSLARLNWDLKNGEGYPGCVQYCEEGKITTEYCRFGDNTGIEPLVIYRDFHGIRPEYNELCEEFRLFHRLYHDRKQDNYIKIDDNGSEDLIATIEPKRIEIRLKELRQFLAAKEMHLAILFDCRENSGETLDELVLKPGVVASKVDLLHWELRHGELRGMKSCRAFSRLMGKRLIPPLPKEKSGIWGFAVEEQKKYVDFIISADENGDDILHTSDPDALSNYFGANSGAPHYLTAVHFRKEVLEKYYQQPAKYKVEDGILRCAYLWSLDIDNDHDNKVCVWLGDLGRDLPYDEQIHWRSHNISPAGGMSETFIRRQIFAEPTDSNRPEHVFRQRYHELAKSCQEYLGWQLLLPLTTDDEHHFHCLRLPSTDEQRDFDDLVLGLTKILIDSLNEKSLNTLISDNGKSGLKGSISRLEAAFAACGVAGYSDYVAFLRRLQDLRSSGSAHRKGSNYRKIAADFNVDSQNLRVVFVGILSRAIDILDYLNKVVRGRQLNLRKPSDEAGDPA